MRGAILKLMRTTGQAAACTMAEPGLEQAGSRCGFLPPARQARGMIKLSQRAAAWYWLVLARTHLGNLPRWVVISFAPRPERASTARALRGLVARLPLPAVHLRGMLMGMAMLLAKLLSMLTPKRRWVPFEVETTT
jgi:hypothetical protein